MFDKTLSVTTAQLVKLIMGGATLDLRDFANWALLEKPHKPVGEALVEYLGVRSFDFQLRETYETHGKIAAVKVCRELTGMGLKECKDLIEERAGEYGWILPVKW